MKIKHGKAFEISEQLSPDAANTIAQWIGCYTVIRNQKVLESKREYAAWLNKGCLEGAYPKSSAAVAHLCKALPFLKDVPSQIRRNAGAKFLESLNAAKIGLRSQPKVKPKHKKRNCYVTNELFYIQPLDKTRCIVHLKKSAKKEDKGNHLAGIVMPFPASDASKSLYLSRTGSRFWLSMSYDLELDVESEDDICNRLQAMTDEELEAALAGYDLGVARQVTGSDGSVYHLPDEAQKKLEKLDKKRKRYQKHYARVARANDRIAAKRKNKAEKRKRTNGEKKLLNKAAQCSAKKARIQLNNSHHQSKAIAENTPLIAVFEDLKILNLTRKPKAKHCPETGKWLKNGATAKRAANRAIYGANMGQIRSMSEYKLKDRGKLAIRIPPHHTSQECSACGYIHKDNRKTQKDFKCLSCHYAANADDNASLVIKKRGIRHIRSEAFSKEKAVRKISVRKRIKAQELASSGGGDNVSLAETQATVCDALNSQRTPAVLSAGKLGCFSSE